MVGMGGHGRRGTGRADSVIEVVESDNDSGGSGDGSGGEGCGDGGGDASGGGSGPEECGLCNPVVFLLLQ